MTGKELQDKVRGSLVGGAVGDALGYPVEFMSYDQKWTLYPDGRYFEDEDGFGGESNNEETVYCVINRDLEIIRSFAYVPDVKAMLKEVAKNK